jgi:hypothetical protein
MFPILPLGSANIVRAECYRLHGSQLNSNRDNHPLSLAQTLPTRKPGWVFEDDASRREDVR